MLVPDYVDHAMNIRVFLQAATVLSAFALSGGAQPIYAEEGTAHWAYEGEEGPVHWGELAAVGSISRSAANPAPAQPGY